MAYAEARSGGLAYVPVSAAELAAALVALDVATAG